MFISACFRNGKLGRNSKGTKLTDPGICYIAGSRATEETGNSSEGPPIILVDGRPFLFISTCTGADFV